MVAFTFRFAAALAIHGETTDHPTFRAGAEDQRAVDRAARQGRRVVVRES
jgi:hypothetical protein